MADHYRPASKALGHKDTQAERHAAVRSLLAEGTSDTACVEQLMERFGCSQATAYRDIAATRSDLQAEARINAPDYSEYAAEALVRLSAKAEAAGDIETAGKLLIALYKGRKR